VTVMHWILVSLVALGVLYWLANALLTVRMVRRVPVLERLRPPEPQTWPRLSLIVPARNEADSIEAATRSRLDDGYPKLEVVLVDDRSDDGTGEIIDRLAEADARVRALHITELPDGWLGKVHALHCGAEVATGEWLLFSDADVHVAPGTFARTVAYCEHRGLDHLALIPQFWPASFLLACGLAYFIRLICLSLRLWAVEDPKSSAKAGVGAFNLVRREAFEQAGGLHELRLTVGDDVGLGQLLKDAGARCAVVNGRGHVGLHFYRTLGEAARATEKSALVVFQFSYLRFVSSVLALLWCELSPIVALALAFVWAGGGSLGSSGTGSFAAIVLGGLGAAGLTLALFSALVINRWIRMPLLPATLFPVGALLSAVVTARAVALAAWRGGHMWRGVLYPTELLRAGNRLRFP
jgi:cellulose synthase/poly-beta-1,6-N-acetylglucosamine synthase-like glycosyltransferase